jgi:predicted dehydrogenase
LACGVAGAGVFGGYHAAQYAGAPGARLAAVFDQDLERAKALAARTGATAFDDLDAFLAAVEAVSVTTPARTHGPLARKALEAGRHVYVEKPIALDVEEAEGLLGLAAQKGLVLAVGHQERLAFAASGLFEAPERPVRLEAVRRGLYSPRNRDVSCVLDLMIHDLDLALALDPSEVFAVEAEGRVREGPGLDEVRAEAIFESGLVAVFETSRMADARERTMRLVYPSGAVEIDFLTRTLQSGAPFPVAPAFAETPAGRDPLKAALGLFLADVARGGADNAGAARAVRALDLALAVPDRRQGSVKPGEAHPSRGAAADGASSAARRQSRGV